jgi:two-component system sensor histidine kinase BarA
VNRASAELAYADVDHLEAVLDRDAVADLCRDFHELFGISVRVISSAGGLLADVHNDQAICRYVNELAGGADACARTVATVREVHPSGGSVTHPCFTGAMYRVVPIEYHGRVIGRFVLGPYLPAELREVPKSLLVIDAALDPERARETLATMPRVKEETAQRIASHLRNVIDLVLFARHRAKLTSEMHVASVRESYRELAEKTASLEQAYTKLQELDRLKSNFLATVSHELRTPLTSILGYSEMLENGLAGELNEEQREFVRTIRDKGTHLLSLIASLLDVNRLEQGTVHLEPQPIDVHALLDEVQKTVAPHAQRKGVRLSVTTAAEVPMLRADPMRLRQILFNLADNAVKFTRQGGTVALSAKRTELEPASSSSLGAVLMEAPRAAIEIAISDDGIGIPIDEQTRIFDAFYQVDGSSTREHGGAGLGLSIVKRLVLAHGGQIRVESEVGTGTTFFVVLPAGDPS